MAYRRRHFSAKPIKEKPKIIISHVAGSGTAEVTDVIEMFDNNNPSSKPVDWKITF